MDWIKEKVDQIKEIGFFVHSYFALYLEPPDASEKWEGEQPKSELIHGQTPESHILK